MTTSTEDAEVEAGKAFLTASVEMGNLLDELDELVDRLEPAFNELFEGMHKVAAFVGNERKRLEAENATLKAQLADAI